MLLNRDLTDSRWMYLKAGVVPVIGVTSVALILAEHPHWKLVVLLALAIWSFARCYYFAFYVIEKYIDPTFKFAGLWIGGGVSVAADGTLNTTRTMRTNR